MSLPVSGARSILCSSILGLTTGVDSRLIFAILGRPSGASFIRLTSSKVFRQADEKGDEESLHVSFGRLSFQKNGQLPNDDGEKLFFSFLYILRDESRLILSEMKVPPPGPFINSLFLKLSNAHLTRGVMLNILLY